MVAKQIVLELKDYRGSVPSKGSGREFDSMAKREIALGRKNSRVSVPVEISFECELDRLNGEGRDCAV